MKKKLLFGLLVSMFALTGIGCSSVIEARAETSEVEVTETATYSITFAQPEHGTITIDEADIEGEVGKTVEIQIDPDLFYLIKTVKVNDAVLVESETMRGLYSFVPTAGENVLSVEIAINEELFGDFYTIVEQVKNRDWASLLSVENIIRFVSLLFSSGLLTAIVIYFIKNKKLEEKIIKEVTKIVKKALPDLTSESVKESVSKLIEPYFKENKAQLIRIVDALAVFSKCFALMQEDTPDSRRAVLDELAKLNLGDITIISEIQKYIEEELAKRDVERQENLETLNSIEERNSAVVSEKPKEEEEKESYDGTEI